MSCFKILIPLALSFTISCRSQSDKIVEDFKKVNESLEQTNGVVDSMNQAMKFVEFDPFVADSLEQVFNESSEYISYLKNELNKADSLGEKLDVAEHLLINTPRGDSLYNHVMNLYDLGIKYSDSSSKQDYNSLKKYNKEMWLNRYFKRVPTVAAVTVLSKFQNDFIKIRLDINAGAVDVKNKPLAE